METGIEFHIKLAGVPDGAEDKVTWLSSKEARSYDVTPADDERQVVIGTLTAVAPKGIKDGSEVIYTYSPHTPFMMAGDEDMVLARVHHF